MKILKKITTLVLTMVMTFVMVESASAAEIQWTAMKTAGMSGYGVTYRDVPLYKGEMTLRLDSTSGGCSYLVAKMESAYSNYYWINNSTKNVKLTEVGGEQDFYMTFTSEGERQAYMTYKCTVEHNAAIYQQVYATATIYY